MQTLRKAGITGTLTVLAEVGPGGFHNFTMRPGGDLAGAFVILDHPPTQEVRLPQPRHTMAFYIQQASGWQTLQANGPTLTREIVLVPENDPFQTVFAYTQDIDGGYPGPSLTFALPPRCSPSSCGSNQP
jgi:hypothetical protein